MYDPVFNESFSIYNVQAVTNASWWGGEPIWVTAQLQNQIAATYFWPGSEAPIMNVRPTYWEMYNYSIPYSTRVDKILYWLDLPAEARPTLICAYFELVDSIGHEYGPNSPQIDQAIQTVDSTIGSILAGLEARGILDDINIIVTSDHGMTTVNRSQVILIDNYINMSDARVVEFNPILSLIPEEGQEQQIFDALSNAHPNFTVYLKADLPDLWNYKNNRRVTPIVGVADLGWSVGITSQLNNSKAFTGGTHGYDNRLADMQAIFIGRGPALKQGYQVDSINNVDVYSLICQLLSLNPAANNGSMPINLLR